MTPHSTRMPALKGTLARIRSCDESLLEFRGGTFGSSQSSARFFLVVETAEFLSGVSFTTKHSAGILDLTRAAEVARLSDFLPLMEGRGE